MDMIRLRDGRGEREVERDTLFAAMTAGQAHIQGDVQPEPDGPWITAGVWYLNHSQIDPKGDVEGRRYIDEHVAARLDLTDLLDFLGAPEILTADVGIAGTVYGHEGIVMPSWGESSWGRQHIVDHIATPAWAPDPAGAIADTIQVPQWGSPLLLPVVQHIAVPDWRDPAEAPVRTPVEPPLVWRRLVVEQAIAPPPKAKVAAAKRRPVAVRAVARAAERVERTPSARQKLTTREQSEETAKKPRGKRRAARAAAAEAVKRPPEAQASPYGRAGSASEAALKTSSGIGLFGCLGQLLGLMALVFVVTIAADFGLQSAIGRLRALNIGTPAAAPAPAAPTPAAAPPAPAAQQPPPVEALPPALDIQPPEGAATMGSPKAAVTVLVFIDFHCPFSKRHAANYSRLIKDFGADVRLAIAHLPIAELHPNAEAAASLALAAQAQGLFWPAHDLLFERAELPWSDRDTVQALVELASAADMRLRTSRLRRHRKSRALPVLAEHGDLARKYGVAGTPSTFVNGRPLRGAVSYERLRQVVQAEVDAVAGDMNRSGEPVEAP